MAYQTKTWKDRQVEYPARRKLTEEASGISAYYAVERAEGAVVEAGDAFSASNMNDLESRISSGISGMITYGNTDLTPGVSTLATGSLYIYIPSS